MAKQKGHRRVTRILLVDDHPMIRERLADLIRTEADLMVCGEAEDREGALALVESTGPDLAIVDLTLKHSHGLDLIKELRARHPALLILVVSMHDEALHAERVIRAGASGFVNKQEATRDTLRAIRRVLEGNIYLSPAMTSRVTAKIAGRPRLPPGLCIDSLTDRELCVFEMLGRGYGTREIAGILRLDMRTVETYRARIKEKLHLKNANQLLQYAIRWWQTAGKSELAPVPVKIAAMAR
jgi:DNA-binding NarL/FixJ family response regulator